VNFRTVSVGPSTAQGGNIAATREPSSSIKHWLTLRDLVATCAGDVLNRDRQVPDLQSPVRNVFDASPPLNEHPLPASVHHDFRNGRIDQEILDRFQERQDAIQAHRHRT
jgi:hypothetical protein